MTPEQAKGTAALLSTVWEGEAKGTAQVLAAVGGNKTMAAIERSIMAA